MAWSLTCSACGREVPPIYRRCPLCKGRMGPKTDVASNAKQPVSRRAPSSMSDKSAGTLRTETGSGNSKARSTFGFKQTPRQVSALTDRGKRRRSSQKIQRKKSQASPRLVQRPTSEELTRQRAQLLDAARAKRPVYRARSVRTVAGGRIESNRRRH
jgi:hypothetical protein